MVHVRKRKVLFALLCSVGLLWLNCCTAFAADTDRRVFDDARLFSVEEVQSLTARIAEISESTGLDFAIVTTDDADGKTAQDYADDFYDSHDFGAGTQRSGALMLIDMDNREVYISTAGYAISLYTDRRIEAMLDDVFVYLPDGAYYQSAVAFLDSAEKYALQGTPNRPSERYDPATDSLVVYHGYSAGEIALAIVVPLAGAVAIFLAVVLNYNQDKKILAYPFRHQSRVSLTRSEDMFINKTLTSRPIEINSGGTSRSGGGSSTHMSSSGSTHGGGGRRF